jgi:hypothetical protein
MYLMAHVCIDLSIVPKWKPDSTESKLGYICRLIKHYETFIFSAQIVFKCCLWL